MPPVLNSDLNGRTRVPDLRLVDVSGVYDRPGDGNNRVSFGRSVPLTGRPRYSGLFRCLDSIPKGILSIRIGTQLTVGSLRTYL